MAPGQTMIETYNIHDLIHLEVRRPDQFDLIPEISQPFRYFASNHTSETPDILLEVGDFEAVTTGSYIVDHQYYLKDNYFFCHDTWGPYSWKIEITGFETGLTRIRFTSRGYSVRDLFAPGLLPEGLLLKQVIAYHLYRKGYRLLHAAAGVRNGRAVLLFGRAGAYKTSLIMNMMRHDQTWSYLSDDLAIIGQGEILSFPMNLGVFAYRYHHLPDEAIPAFRRWEYIRYLRDFDQPDFKIARSGVIDGLVHCSTCKISDSHIEPVPLEENLLAITAVSSMEDYFSPNIGSPGIFPRYVEAYSYVFPGNQLQARWDSAVPQVPAVISSMRAWLPIRRKLKAIMRLADEIDNMFG